jgi:cytochrome c oxidase subunit IV
VPEHIVPRKQYAAICGALLVFTFLTWRVALINLGRWNVVVALTISFCKATLVGLFFMHLRYSPRRTQLVVVAGLLWLSILLLLTLSDYLTRFS